MSDVADARKAISRLEITLYVQPRIPTMLLISLLYSLLRRRLSSFRVFFASGNCEYSHEIKFKQYAEASHRHCVTDLVRLDLVTASLMSR